MKYCTCDSCDNVFEVSDAEKDKAGKWFVICPRCGSWCEINIEDFLIPEGTLVRLADGSEGTIRSFSDDDAVSLKDVVYHIGPNLGWYRRDAFEITETWKKLCHTGYGLQRVCHHPKNREQSSAPCYNCVDRARCNAELFDQLAAYEATDLTPAQVLAYKEFVGKILSFVREFASDLPTDRGGPCQKGRKEG